MGFDSHEHGAQGQIGDLLAQHLAASDLLGRLQMAKYGLAKTRRSVRLALTAGPHLTFAEEDRKDTFQGDTLDVGFSFDLPSEGAINYLRNLTPVTRHLFDGLTRQYQGDAFTVAGVSDQRLIAKIRDQLSETLAQGGTAGDFRKSVDAMCTDAGIDKLAAFELDTVFQTNVAKAYSGGRLEQMREPGMMDALPYWQYWTVGDMRVRPAHAALDLFCARAIDPVWRLIYPPWGFNCRCSVVPISADEAPEGSDEGGIERLPLMARLEARQSSFKTLIAA